MMLHALLVSKDDQAAETLAQVLSNYGIAIDRLSAVEVAVARLSEQRFDQLIVDCDDPEGAAQVLEANRQQAAAEHVNPAVTVALISNPAEIRRILGVGAHFILSKPLARQSTEATLRAATALLKRERRQTFRVPVQASVALRTGVHDNLEGILFDLSTGGMDVLAAKPLPSATLVHFAFELPDSGGQLEGAAEVAWASPNGQTGLRFLEMDTPAREKLADWLAARAHDALPEEPDPVSQCKLTDMSLGGCYVETESPFPQNSAVDLCLKAAGLEIHTDGLVRVMHPSHGMGIEFPARTEEQRKSVADFIEFLTSRPGTMPQLEISPRALVANPQELNVKPEAAAELDDPLLELLRSGGAREESEFLAELHRQRTSAAVS
jgi:CheY-like chemotaxis protein